MKGRWAAGIVPRNFAWIIKGHLAVSERPGGSAPDHRRVRRQEEILWLRAQGFTRVVSLLPSTHNLHAYEELGLDCADVPIGVHADLPTVLGELYPRLLGWLHAGDRILVHQDELGDRVAGVFAGFLWWSGMIPEPPLAISAIEHLLRRQLGSAGRTIATLAMEVPPPPEEDRRHPAPPQVETAVSLRLEERETIGAGEAPVAGRGPAPSPGEAPTAAVVGRRATVADISSRRSTTPARRSGREASEPPPVSPLRPTPPVPKPRTPAQKPTAKVARTPVTRSPSQSTGTATRKRAPRPAKAVAHKPAAKKVNVKGRVSVPKPATNPPGSTARAAPAAGGTRGNSASSHRRAGAR